VRFDEYEARHPMHVDVVKIDVEDFEADVLKGMRGIICRDRPFIVCEILPRLHGTSEPRKSSQLLTTNHTGFTSAGYVKVPSSISSRQFHRFPALAVSTPDIVLDELDVLWD